MRVARSHTRHAHRPRASLAALVAGFLSCAGPAAAKGPTVLDLDSDDPKTAARLSSALRDAVRERGLEPGPAAPSLLELRFTLGCDDLDDACLLAGVRKLGLDEAIYGSVEAVPGGWMVSLSLGDAAQGKVQRRLAQRVDADALSDAARPATAASLLAALYGDAGAEADDPFAALDAAPAPAEVSRRRDREPRAGREGAPARDRLVWGRDPAPPAWKGVGLGVSAAVTVGAVIGATVTGVSVRRGGRLYRALIREAEASLEDGDPTNDVDPNQRGDLCGIARSPTTAGGIRNPDVAKVCDRADRNATVATTLIIVSGVGVVSTAVFTTLLFVHKERPAAAALLRRGVKLGAAPLPGGGAWLVGGIDF